MQILKLFATMIPIISFVANVGDGRSSSRSADTS